MSRSSFNKAIGSTYVLVLFLVYLPAMQKAWVLGFQFTLELKCVT